MQRSDDEKLYADEEKGAIESTRPLLRDGEDIPEAGIQVRGGTKEQDANKFRTIGYLGMYFMMNLSLTFYNKLVLGSVR